MQHVPARPASCMAAIVMPLSCFHRCCCFAGAADHRSHPPGCRGLPDFQPVFQAGAHSALRLLAAGTDAGAHAGGWVGEWVGTWMGGRCGCSSLLYRCCRPLWQVAGNTAGRQRREMGAWLSCCDAGSPVSCQCCMRSPKHVRMRAHAMPSGLTHMLATPDSCSGRRFRC